MATAEKILEIARSQIGTKESPAKSDNVKYNTAYYGRAVSGGGYPWCAVFVWWVFREAGASDLYYGGDKTAYCPTLMFFHKKQKVTNYRPGDIVFFNFSGRSSAGHVGICESWDGTYITVSYTHLDVYKRQVLLHGIHTKKRMSPLAWSLRILIFQTH